MLPFKTSYSAAKLTVNIRLDLDSDQHHEKKMTSGLLTEFCVNFKQDSGSGARSVFLHVSSLHTCEGLKEIKD